MLPGYDLYPFTVNRGKQNKGENMNAPQQLDTSQLFKTEISDSLLLKAPNSNCQELENMIRRDDDHFFRNKPVLKNSEEYELRPEVLVQKTRELESKHLKDSLTNYQLTKQRLERERDTTQRTINYITSPLSTSSDATERNTGVQLKMYARQLANSEMTEADIDELIASKNNDTLGELRKIYNSRTPKDRRQAETIGGIKNKINNYFKSTTGLETHEAELNFINRYLQIANSRISQIEAMQKLPNVSMYMR